MYSPDNPPHSVYVYATGQDKPVGRSWPPRFAVALTLHRGAVQVALTGSSVWARKLAELIAADLSIPYVILPSVP